MVSSPEPSIQHSDGHLGPAIQVSDLDTDVFAFIQQATIIAPSATSGSATAAAIAALLAGPGGGTILLAEGTHTWDVTPALPSGLSRKIRVMGHGVDATTIKLTAASQGAFNLDVTTNDQIFQKLELSDFTVDCDNKGGRGHVVFGTVSANFGSIFQLRVNVDGFRAARIKAINVPTASSGTNLRSGIQIDPQSDLAFDTVTPNYLRNIRIEDVEIYGGNLGISVAPIIDGSAGQTDSTGAPYEIDNIAFKNCYHDSITTPSAFVLGSANFFIGGRAKGGSCFIENCTGKNSADVGIEVDALARAIIFNPDVTDAFNYSYYHTNYNTPLGGVNRGQNLTLYSPTGRRVNFTPAAGSTTTGLGFVFARHATFGVGDVKLIDAVWERSTADWQSFGEAINVNGSMKLTVRGLDIRKTAIAVNPSATRNTSDIVLVPAAGVGSMAFDLDGVRFTHIGAQSGANIINYYPILYKGDTSAAVFRRVNVNNVVFDFRVTGVNGNPTHAGIYSQLGTFNYWRHSNVQVINIGGDPTGTFRMFTFDTSANAIIPFSSIIDGYDTTILSASNKGITIPSTTTQARLRLKGAVLSNGSLHVSSAITVTASDFVYTNADLFAERVIVQGGTVTTISFLGWADGGYTDTGETSGQFLLEPGDKLKVAYAVAPTMTKTPLVR